MKKIIAALFILGCLKTTINTVTATPILFNNYADTAKKHKPAQLQDTTAADTTKTVHVKGYYRKDGKYVAPYTRSAPRKKH